MRIRHRIPSIFSLSMVDVLCCALGCVILLWLLNARQQEEEAEELVEKARIEREQSETQIIALTSDRDATRRSLDELEGKVVILTKERDDRDKDLSQQRSAAVSLQSDLEASRRRVIVLTGQLKKANLDIAAEKNASGKQLAEADARLRGVQLDLDREKAAGQDLEKRSQSLEAEIQLRQKEALALTKRMSEMEATRRTLSRTLETQEKALALALPYKERWQAAEDRVRALETDLGKRSSALEQARLSVATLEGEKKALTTAIGLARAAVDNRFAGIELTGKKVIFLVDISGSMEMVDEKTLAPEKWVEVRNTVARLMRSLGALEKYQVITFSTDVNYPLGSEGEWLDFDAKKSPEQVLKTMAAIKPKGGTNMFSAFQSAFRYRAQGLDTIYFLSDGLPNIGEGLPTNRTDLSELDRGTLLGRHIRQTLQKDWNAVTAGKPRVRINTIGFFFESPELGAFLWALAREHEGSFVGMSRP
jgi:von Willebrand factor type A domain